MRLSWKIYSLFYALIILSGAVYSLWPYSHPIVYYRILISFDKIFIWQYALHYAGILLDVFGLVPLFLFVFQKRWLPKLFWKIFFFIKVYGIFVGNYYEANIMQTISAANKLIAFSSLITGLIIILPAYIAIFLYAFRRKWSPTGKPAVP